MSTRYALSYAMRHNPIPFRFKLREKQKPETERFGFFGDPSETRTPDTLIKSQSKIPMLLYFLKNYDFFTTVFVLYKP